MNLIGSKIIETERLILRSSKMEEQKRLDDKLSCRSNRAILG